MPSRKQNRAAYNAELRRIRAFIKRAEKRGFRFEKIPGLDVPVENPQKADIERLKALNRYSLYKYATAISEKTGDIVSGTERRKEERLQSAAKAQKTTRNKKAKGNIIAVKGYEVVYENVKGLIMEFPTKGATYLNKLLASEIRRYGRDPVLKSMMEANEELISLAQHIIYYEDRAENLNRSLRAFADIIQMHIRDQQEERELGDVQEEAVEEAALEDDYIPGSAYGFAGWMHDERSEDE